MDELVTLHASIVFFGYVIFVIGLVKVVVHFQRKNNVSLIIPLIMILAGLCLIVFGFFQAWNR